MKTILSQLNDNSWYQNFTSLNQVEHSALHRVLYPWADGKVHEREMVVLQVLKEESKLSTSIFLKFNNYLERNLHRFRRSRTLRS